MKIEIELPDDAVPGQHGVYVLFDGDGEVLYIGRTRDLMQRLKNHRSQAQWWASVRSLEWTPCADAVEARVVERQMIEAFHPDANRNDWVPLQQSWMVLPPAVAEALRAFRAAASEVGFRDTDENCRFRAYVVALRRAGWTLSAIGYPLGVTREYVRQVEAQPLDTSDLPDVPTAPARPVKVKPLGKWASLPHLADETAEWLRTLHADARNVNGGTPSDDPWRVASVRLTELIAAEVIRGVTIAEIARCLGVTHFAVRSRLARHGYMEPAPSQESARYLGRPRQPIGVTSSSCSRGHDLTGENLRISSPGGVRVCRKCERIHSAAYRERQAETA